MDTIRKNFDVLFPLAAQRARYGETPSNELELPDQDLMRIYAHILILEDLTTPEAERELQEESESMIGQLRQGLDRLESEVASKRKSIEVEMANMQRERSLLDSNISKGGPQDYIAELQQQREALSDGIRQLRASLPDLSVERERIEGQIRSLEGRKVSEEVDSLKARKAAMEKNFDAPRQEILTRMQLVAENINVTENYLTDLNAALDRRAEIAQEAQENLDVASANLNRARGQVSEAEQLIEKISADLESAEQKLGKLERPISVSDFSGRKGKKLSDAEKTALARLIEERPIEAEITRNSIEELKADLRVALALLREQQGIYQQAESGLRQLQGPQNERSNAGAGTILQPAPLVNPQDQLLGSTAIGLATQQLRAPIISFAPAPAALAEPAAVELVMLEVEPIREPVVESIPSAPVMTPEQDNTLWAIENSYNQGHALFEEALRLEDIDPEKAAETYVAAAAKFAEVVSYTPENAQGSHFNQIDALYRADKILHRADHRPQILTLINGLRKKLKDYPEWLKEKTAEVFREYGTQAYASEHFEVAYKDFNFAEKLQPAGWVYSWLRALAAGHLGMSDSLDNDDVIKDILNKAANAGRVQEAKQALLRFGVRVSLVEPAPQVQDSPFSVRPAISEPPSRQNAFQRLRNRFANLRGPVIKAGSTAAALLAAFFAPFPTSNGHTKPTVVAEQQPAPVVQPDRLNPEIRNLPSPVPAAPAPQLAAATPVTAVTAPSVVAPAVAVAPAIAAAPAIVIPAAAVAPTAAVARASAPPARNAAGKRSARTPSRPTDNMADRLNQEELARVTQAGQPVSGKTLPQTASGYTVILDTPAGTTVPQVNQQYRIDKLILTGDTNIVAKLAHPTTTVQLTPGEYHKLWRIWDGGQWGPGMSIQVKYAPNAMTPGGIDLEKTIVIARQQGPGVKTAFNDPAMLKMLMEAKGLAPVIYGIDRATVPMMNMLLGFNTAGPELPTQKADNTRDMHHFVFLARELEARQA